jgi:hypothetical protein
MPDIITNRDLLQKADLALSELTSSGGVLQPAQSENFMRLMIEEARVLREATVIPMKSPIQIVDKVRFASRILKNGVSQQALSLGDRSKPGLSKTTLTAALFKAEADLDSETLEDNIEQGRFRDTIMQLMAESVARDMDEVIVQGDTTSADLFLASFNGMIAGATSNVVNASSVNLSKSILKQTIKAMPNEFLRDKSQLRFFTSLDAETDYKDQLADRGYAVGDKYVLENVPAAYGGVPVIGVPKFPENPTNVILTDPKNVLIGIWRQIMIETDKDISAGIVKIVATLRFVFAYAQETAAVKVTNVKTTG